MPGGKSLKQKPPHEPFEREKVPQETGGREGWR